MRPAALLRRLLLPPLQRLALLVAFATGGVSASPVAALARRRRADARRGAGARVSHAPATDRRVA